MGFHGNARSQCAGNLESGFFFGFGGLGVSSVLGRGRPSSEHSGPPTRNNFLFKYDLHSHFSYHQDLRHGKVASFNQASSFTAVVKLTADKVAFRRKRTMRIVLFLHLVNYEMYR